MKLRKNMIIKIILIYLAVDIGIVLFTILESNMSWFINTQIAFFSSLLITIGSYFSLKKSINTRVATYEANEGNDRDEIDKIEDRFDLYDDEKEETKSDEEVLKEEKAKLRKDMFKNLKYSGSFFSIYRIIGYVVLVLGFLFLTKNHYFEVYPYIFGLLVVPITSMFSIFFIKK